MAKVVTVIGLSGVSKSWMISRYAAPANVACHSAWGPNADRRTNSLNCPRKEGSTSEADLQADSGDPIRLGASDNEGVNLWIGYGAIYVQGGQQS